MPEIIIVNTSPLFYLHRLGLLEVLNKLYGNITVPEAVKTELEAGQIQGEDVPQLENYTWINVKIVNMPKYLKLIADLGPGESESYSGKALRDELAGLRSFRVSRFRIVYRVPSSQRPNFSGLSAMKKMKPGKEPVVTCP